MPSNLTSIALCIGASLHGERVASLWRATDGALALVAMKALDTGATGAVQLPDGAWKRVMRAATWVAVLGDDQRVALFKRGDKTFRVVGLPTGTWTDISGNDDAFIISGNERRALVLTPETQAVDVLQSPSGEGVGIHYCIHGSNDDFMVGGYEGEVWRCTNRAWTRLSYAPELGPITAVCATSQQLGYAVGRNGLVLRFDGPTPKQIVFTHPDHPGKNLLRGLRDFWGVSSYNGALRVSTFNGVFAIDETTGEPTEDVLADDVQVSTYGLSCDDKRLLSWGERDLRLFDGNTWTEVAFELPD